MSRIETYERPAVLLAEDPHQGRESHPGVLSPLILGEHGGKSDRMDAHPAVSLVVLLVDPVDLFHDLVDRVPRELVAEDVKAHLLVGGGEGPDRGLDSLDGAAVAEGRPVPQAREDEPP